MVEKIVAEFSIRYHQCLDELGRVTGELPDFAKDFESMLAMYRMMQQTRLFDTKAIALQRTGQLGTYPSSLGQEAISVGIGAAMQTADVLCPYYREYGAHFWRGISMTEMYAYWGGTERGSNFQVPKQDFPVAIPIASQTLHATGVAMAMKLRKQKRAAVAVIGDGGTSRGDFYESINLAGNWQLPAVYVINNNQWAISIPRNEQTAAQTIAQKAIAGGVEALQIDGNDIIMMRQAMQTALQKAYAGNGATVIEAITYRMCDHTTADDASRYRDPVELEAARSKDPITRCKQYLIAEFDWNEEKDQALIVELKQEVEKAVAAYLAMQPEAPTAMFDHLYAELPEAMYEQYAVVQERGENLE